MPVYLTVLHLCTPQAQEVAQLAINASDTYLGAQARVDAARAELEGAQQERDFLMAEMERLRSELERPDDAAGGEGEDAAFEEALVTGALYAPCWPALCLTSA